MPALNLRKGINKGNILVRVQGKVRGDNERDSATLLWRF